jgi:hypothetical protein
MKIPKNPRELLGNSNGDLFRKGGCHVLADALVRRFSELDYRLRAMEDEQWLQSPHNGKVRLRGRELFHVCAEVEGWIIDVDGVRREEDYMRDYEAKHRMSLGAETTEIFRAFARYCDHSEIFTEVRTEDAAGRISQHRLYLDPLFLQIAGERAEALIDTNPGLFDIRLHNQTC